MSENNQNEACDSCAKRAENAFVREVDEELRQERMYRLWRKCRWLFYGAIVAAIAGTAGFEAHQSWYAKVRLNESDAFEQAVVAAYTGRQESALTELRALSQRARTGYRYLAQMETAGVLLRAGKTAEALDVLNHLRQDKKAPEQIRAVATLSFVGHQVDAGSPSELQPLLQPLLKEASFAPLAAELTAVLLVRQGQKNQAADVLKKTMQMPVAPAMQERMAGMVSVLEKE